MATKKPEPTLVEDPNLDSVVRELEQLRYEKKALAAREEDLVKLLTHERGPGDYQTQDGGAFKITVTNTLDKQALEQAYPYDASDANRALYRTEIDTGAVKNAFAANALAAFYKQGKPQVRVV